MRLTKNQRSSLEAWMAERDHTFGLFRKCVTIAWLQYLDGGGLPVSLQQFYAIRLYAFCTGVIKDWRGQRKGLDPVQRMLFTDTGAATAEAVNEAEAAT